MSAHTHTNTNTNTNKHTRTHTHTHARAICGNINIKRKIIQISRCVLISFNFSLAEGLCAKLDGLDSTPFLVHAAGVASTSVRCGDDQ